MELNNEHKTKEERYHDIYTSSYDNLIYASELDIDDLTDSHCDNAVKALTNILKYGNCKEVAHGLKHFVNFLWARNEISEH